MKYICSLLLYTCYCFSVSANEGEMKVATYIEPPFVELIDNKLVGEVSLKGNEVIEDKDLQVLVNRSEFLSNYGTTALYRISE